MAQYDILAKVYDLLMEDVNGDEWAGYLHSILVHHEKQAKRIADVGCGTGSVTIGLKKLGYDTIGVDNSTAMLDIAANNARKAGMGTVRFIRQDAADLSLPMHDAIVAACDVVNYLSRENLISFIKRAYKTVAEDGVLLFDISSETKLLRMAEESFYYEDLEDITYFWENELEENAGQRALSMALTLFLRDGDIYLREEEYQTQYIYGAEELLQLLLSCGFDAKAYGFGTMLPPEEEDDRIQFYATKLR